jgi:hypothetical protein
MKINSARGRAGGVLHPITTEKTIVAKPLDVNG